MASCSGNCGSCGNCASCGGCGASLVLTQAELRLLESLSQIPFQPIARRADEYSPIYLEDSFLPASTWAQVLLTMEKKGLITLDFDRAISGFDYGAYEGYPLRGSMALTARGQNVLDMLRFQGIEE